jgi:type VI secretion system ImpM family protein
MTSVVVRGYYGKLPLSPEFLRLHASGPELRWLDDWLQRGVLYAKSKEGPQWSTLLAKSEVWNFLYVPTGSGRIVCGALCMSQDKAGRSFPFLTFLLLDDESLFKHLWVVPLMTAVSLQELKSMLESLRSSLDWSEFCQRLDAVPDPHLNVMSVLEDFDWYLRTATVKRFWADGVQDADHMMTLLRQGLLDTAKRSGPGTHSRASKFPLEVTEMSKPYDVSFWIAALTRVVSRKDKASGLVAFWNRNPKDVAPCVIVSLGPGSPNIVRFLISPSSQDDSWRDIKAEKHPESRHDAQSAPLNHPEASLQQLLDSLTLTV